MDLAHQATMDRVYRHMKYVYDATRPLFLAGRGRLRCRVTELRPARVLEVGCGTARNLVLLSRRMPGTHFTGLDISREMLRFARTQIDKRGLGGRVALIEGEISDLILHRAADEPYDVALFSYSLSMIPDWREALRSAAALLRPGTGTILIADFGGCEAWPRVVQRRLYRNLSYFHVFPRTELVAALAADPRLRVRARPLLGGYAQIVEATFRSRT